MSDVRAFSGLVGHVYGRFPAPKLIVLLHGDRYPRGYGNTCFPWASEIAADGRTFIRGGVPIPTPSDRCAVALVRPGYSDGEGRTSEGGNGRHYDHYTRENVLKVASAIRAIRHAVQPTSFTALGYSGGAATLGILLGLAPSVVDDVVLLGCPADVPRWRAMRSRGEWPNSLSPQDFLSRIPSGTRIRCLTGANDRTVPPELARDYATKARERGLDATYRDIPGADHNDLERLFPPAKEAVFSLLR